MRRRASILVAVAWLGASAASSAEPAVTVKQVSLREAPAADAKAVASLSPNTVVELTKREGAWVQLTAAGDTGWTKLFDIKMGSGTGTGNAKKSATAGIKDTLNLAAGRRDASVTTGVRGLDEETLKQAQPNALEVAKLDGYAATPAQAQAFAETGELEPRDVAPIGDRAPQGADQ